MIKPLCLNFDKSKVLVVGDVMLDQYWFGNTSRISPEAPVPVVLIETQDERPGGAANAALGVSALGAKATVLGVTGVDAASKQLKQLLEDQGVEVHFLELSPHKTTTKLRVISHSQQMIRLDAEKSLDAVLFARNGKDAEFKQRYLALLEGKQAVILSDYGKGTLQDSAWFIKEARKRNIPVIVDPKAKEYSVYRYATVIKPNFKEFESWVGSCQSEDIMVTKALKFLEDNAVEALVISRSEKGMSVITQEGTVTHVPAQVKEVHDVTGAGDTVVAVLATALASGMDLASAARLSNTAAGIAVGKLGAATVSSSEIETALHSDHSLPTGVLSEEALMAVISQSKLRGEKIVFTNGCFDILHAGHVLYLEQAKELGDRLIVGVNDDASVSRLKGPQRPVNQLKNRMALLAGLASVDWVVSFSEDTPLRLIEGVDPHVLVKGGDYSDKQSIVGAKFVFERGGSVEILSFHEGCSTTGVIDQILSTQNDS